MDTPTFITHYYLPEAGPLRSLSDLPNGADDPVFEEFLCRHQKDPAYRRRFGKNYIPQRRLIENKLRELFIAKGGQPKRRHPFYFVLGESPWFRNLNREHAEVRIEIAALNPETVSITYPDSFVALTKSCRPHHDQVFLLSELDDLVRRYELPANDDRVPYEKYWETDFELYIEFQIWDEPEDILLLAR